MASAEPARADWREMLSRMPAATAFTSSDEPPKLTNGRVSPLVGRMASATARFTSACTPNIVEMPNARKLPKSSGARSAARTPRATSSR